jgi:hypothetical protein
LSPDQPTSSPPPGAAPIWGSYGGKGGTPTPAKSTPDSSRASGSRRPGIGISSLFGDEPLEPLSQRLLRLAGLLSVLLLLVLLNSFVNGSENSPSEQLELNPVASAAARVDKFSGGRMSLYIVYSSPALPAPLTASGGGAYNGETGRSRITLDINSPITGDSIRSVQLSDGEFEYAGGAVVADELPPGKKWVRTVKGAGGDDESPMTFEESLEVLGSSAETRLIGRESINGKMTRRYRGEIKISDVVEFLREKGKGTEADAFEQIEGEAPTQISAEGWIDGKNLLRRIRMVLPMPGDPGEPTMTVDMRMDFFDYGAEPNIQLPDPASVVDGPLDEDESAPAPASIS